MLLKDLKKGDDVFVLINEKELKPAKVYENNSSQYSCFCEIVASTDDDTYTFKYSGDATIGYDEYYKHLNLCFCNKEDLEERLQETLRIAEDNLKIAQKLYKLFVKKYKDKNGKI